jgi:hypothetical protein
MLARPYDIGKAGRPVYPRSSQALKGRPLTAHALRHHRRTRLPLPEVAVLSEVNRLGDLTGFRIIL